MGNARRWFVRASWIEWVGVFGRGVFFLCVRLSLHITGNNIPFGIHDVAKLQLFPVHGVRKYNM